MHAAILGSTIYILVHNFKRELDLLSLVNERRGAQRNVGAIRYWTRTAL